MINYVAQSLKSSKGRVYRILSDCIAAGYLIQHLNLGEIIREAVLLERWE